MSRLIQTALIASVLFAAPSYGARFVIKEGAKGNTVRFESKAPLESFEGTTDKVSGYVSLDPVRIGDSVTVYVEVDLASLDTGIEKRNRHMRENHLETEEYPTAVFRGATVLDPSATSLARGETVTFDVEGDFELHGVKRRLRTRVDVTRIETDGMETLLIASDFNIKLSDYAIERPKFLFMKLSEDQGVKFRVTAVATLDGD